MTALRHTHGVPDTRPDGTAAVRVRPYEREADRIGLRERDFHGQVQGLPQATLARPVGSDAGFTRELAWTTQALWPGARAIHTVAASVWRLERPRLSEGGRLVLGGATRASAQPLPGMNDARVADLGCADWPELGAGLRAATGLLRGILVRVERLGAAVLFVPVAVWLGEPGDRLQVLSLDFDALPARARSLTGRLMRLFESRL